MSRTIVTADNEPQPQADIIGGHTLSMFVNNQPGVLMRVCQIFARRAYNLDSVVVSQGRDPRFSRLTLGISGDPKGLDQIILQCNKLIDVIHCSEHTTDDSVAKELVLIKLHVESTARTEALQIVEHFGGKTIDLTDNSMIVMVQGNSDKVDAATRLLGKFDIVETVRTGKVVMARGEGVT